MTDYGQFYEKDDEESAQEKADRLAKEKRKKERAERKKVDKAFEAVVLKSKNTCSANSDLVKYAKHLKAMRKTMKAAAADGFCLDEILDGLRELGDE